MDGRRGSGNGRFEELWGLVKIDPASLTPEMAKARENRIEELLGFAEVLDYLNAKPNEIEYSVLYLSQGDRP